MATKLENAGNSAQPQQDANNENEYIKLITKKLRGLNKKIHTNIANIEKKVAAGAQINEDEKNLLASKPSLEKEVKNFEKIRSEFEKIQSQEKKIKPKKEDFEGSASVSVLVSVLQAALQIKETHKSGGISKEDSEAIVTVAHYITNFAAPNSIAVGTEHANKLLRQVDEQVVLGKTYKQIVQLATQQLNAPSVGNPEPTTVKAVEQPPKDKPNGTPVHEPIVPVEQTKTKIEEPVKQPDVQPQQEEQPEEGQDQQEAGDPSKSRDQKRFFRPRGARVRGGRYHSERENKEYKPRGGGRGRGGTNTNKSQAQ